MPLISMFYGIIIRMYFDDHNPPHFHASYQGHEATFSFDGERIEGELPKKQERLIAAWADIHQDELIANWELLKGDTTPIRINPLH